MNYFDDATLFLKNNGMFDDQATAVMNKFLQSLDANDPIRRVLSEEQGSYPEAIKNVLIARVKITALEYIDEHCPKAWFRPCFLPPDEQERFLSEERARAQAKFAPNELAFTVGQVNPLIEEVDRLQALLNNKS